ncbi:MAG: hypothetical protein AAB436_04505 [Patescibacteria group bacterium]
MVHLSPEVSSAVQDEAHYREQKTDAIQVANETSQKIIDSFEGKYHSRKLNFDYAGGGGWQQYDNPEVQASDAFIIAGEEGDSIVRFFYETSSLGITSVGMLAENEEGEVSFAAMSKSHHDELTAAEVSLVELQRRTSDLGVMQEFLAKTVKPFGPKRLNLGATKTDREPRFAAAARLKTALEQREDTDSTSETKMRMHRDMIVGNAANAMFGTLLARAVEVDGMEALQPSDQYDLPVNERTAISVASTYYVDSHRIIRRLFGAKRVKEPWPRKITVDESLRYASGSKIKQLRKYTKFRVYGAPSISAESAVEQTWRSIGDQERGNGFGLLRQLDADITLVEEQNTEHPQPVDTLVA